MFLKRSLFLFSFFCLCAYHLIAQIGIVSGRVYDAETGESVIGATVFADDANATFTDINGGFKLSIKEGDYILKVKLIGYELEEKNVEIKSSRTITVDFVMKPSSQQLTTVVVSAGKFEQKLEEVTVSMEVIKASLLENNNDINIDAALERVPGVTIIDGQANIRGGSGFSYGAGSRVQVLVDDMPMLAADAGDVKWSFLPIENLEQIEIIKGASSALFGSSAMNGVINMRTAYAKSNPVTKFSLYSSFYEAPKNDLYKWWGQNTQLTTGASFLHAQKFGQWDVVIGSHYMKDDGYRQGEVEERHRFNANTRYRFKTIEGLTAGVNANYMFNAGGLFLIWADDSTQALKPYGGFGNGTSISNYNTIRFTIDPHLTYMSKNGFSYKLRMRYLKTSNFNDTQQESFANLYYGESQLQKIWSRINLTISGGGVIQNGEVVSDLYGIRENVNRSVYAQIDKKFFDKLNVTFGARKEWFKFVYKGTESKPIMRAGANYEIINGTNVRASYGQGYRYPTIAERYIKTQVGPIVIYPNDSVKSETGWSAEFGIRQIFKVSEWKAFIDACVFRNEYRDMLEFTFGNYGKPFVDPFFGIGFKSINIGNTRIDGFELSCGAEGKLFKIPLDIIAGYTYINPIQTDFVAERDTGKNSSNENILKYRYKHTLKADVRVTIKKINIGIGVKYNSFMENIDAVFNLLIPGVLHYRETHSKGDTVYDASIGYMIDQNVKVALICKNLTNHEYVSRPADMQPPRSFVLQVNCSF
jgi:iron complex outermembrane receptor protein